MMKKKKEQTATESRSDRAARMGANLLVCVQRWSMGLVQRAYEVLPPWGRMLVLIMGFLGAAIFFGMLVWNPGTGEGSAFRTLFKEAATVDISAMARTAPEDPVKIRIRRALFYLDSLEQTPAGREKVDSILRERPGLRDSLRLANALVKEE